MTDSPTSHRADGRGHWPQGIRRTPDSTQRRKALAGIRARLKQGWSMRGIAVELEVSDRTLGRWLTERHHPSQDHLDRITAWLSPRRKAAD